MLILKSISAFFAISTVIFASLYVQGNPVPDDRNIDLKYQDEEVFKREINDKIKDLHKNEGKMFDRILMVNSLHKRWKTEYRLKKRGLNSDNVINTINEENQNLLFEGDIVMNKRELSDIKKTESFRRKRNAMHRRKAIWTTRRIPYFIDPGLSLKAREAIQKAMDIIHAKTCVRWVPYTSQKHYVHFKKADGCFSTIGRAYAQSGGQTLSIGEGCEWVSIALHEMTHCMGFFHEQSRNDRNRYITILWQNIPVDLHDQFAMYSHGAIDKMKKDYDLRSLMHYSSTAFGIKGATTIVSLDPTKKIGDAEDFTNLDIEEINALYDCRTSSETQTISSWSDWTECDDSCFKERQRFCFRENRAECPSNTNAYGIESEYVKCSSSECPAPVHGNWGLWSSWGTCSKTCDEGKHRRTRQCNRPAPSNGGKACIGASDDLSTCLGKRCNMGKYDTDFEGGWNIWFTAGNPGLIPWTQHSGSTQTMNTGPQGDHTLQGKGNYVYVESSHRQAGDKALLVSKSLQFTTRQCMRFYYNMYGENIGKLTLYLVPEGKGRLILFTKTGNQGENWHSADVTLDWKGKFQLIFEAEIGKGYSDTALDDIYIDNGACSGYECKDSNTNCQHWANNNQCSDNPGYMHLNCRVSCGVCTTPEAAKTTPLPKTTQLPEKCKDDNTNCQQWAKDNQCSDNPGYMHLNCRVSCGLCTPPKTTKTTQLPEICKDDNSNCQQWAKDNQCSDNPGYMHLNCRVSCGLCTPTEATKTTQLPAPTAQPTTVQQSCSDNDVRCPGWASTGECGKNPEWMKVNCMKSCQEC
ncbi:uncharacterized protein LOC114526809 [Dendronephthya gigantea]|uniref:uncharacterized protein LOC114526809 n=1 Tax=Dendronephthya gigantea TaxID=151771 RepID=UPI00106AD645|nr:uncharacterized protein LOC114526809 [Dendronephthya gigantea]